MKSTAIRWVLSNHNGSSCNVQCGVAYIVSVLLIEKILTSKDKKCIPHVRIERGGQINEYKP